MSYALIWCFLHCELSETECTLTWTFPWGKVCHDDLFGGEHMACFKSNKGFDFLPKCLLSEFYPQQAEGDLSTWSRREYTGWSLRLILKALWQEENQFLTLHINIFKISHFKFFFLNSYLKIYLIKILKDFMLKKVHPTVKTKYSVLFIFTVFLCLLHLPSSQEGFKC